MNNNSIPCDWKRSKGYSYEYIYPQIEKFIKSTRILNNSFILEAGCGGGQLINDLFRRNYTNIYGFDISESGIELAKQLFVEIEDHFFIHDVYEHKLPEGKPQLFDLIISTEVIEHIYDPNKYLLNIYTWLKPKGYLIISSPYHGYLKNFATAILNRSDTHFNSLVRGGHIKFYSKKTMTKLLLDNRFTVKEVRGVGRMPLFWKSMVVLAQKIDE